MKNCNVCGKEFIDNTKPKNKKSCSSECRKKYCSKVSMQWIVDNKERYLKNKRNWRALKAKDLYYNKRKEVSYYV